MTSTKKLNYIYSLLPAQEVLDSIKKIDIVITTDVDGSLSHIRHRNPINNHQYKPIYIKSQKKNHLFCYVATPIIASHVYKGWQIYSEVSGKKYKITLLPSVETDKIYSLHAKNLIRKLGIKENIVFARLDSFIGFLRMKKLIEDYKVSKKNVDKLFIELELHRLKHGLLTIHYKDIYTRILGKKLFEKILKELPLDPIYEGRYLWGQNIIYNDKEFTVINLPWGRDLAETIAKFLPLKKIKNIYLIGGVGSIDENIEIDEIFVPTAVVDKENSRFIIKNKFEELNNNLIFKNFSKRISKGVLCCIDSSLGSKSGSSKEAKANGISAFDMESVGFLKVVNEADINLFMIYYIMDLPLKGLGLSSTYYSRTFLKKLFSKPDRGKYFCFNAVINEILK